ncbi:MAG TPA: hypothetical protein VF774_03495 [Pseudoduganella sp.]|jgi:hypothetical protein
MTSPVATDYPRSSSWQDFERLCMALLSAVHATRFRRWGSAGQRKDGVDAWARLQDGKVVVLRCEGRTERFGQVMTKADIDGALAELAGFPHPVDECILLTTAPDDAALVAYAAQLTASRRAAGQSAVTVWGWQTIGAHISQHPKVRTAFYGHEGKASGGRKLALSAAVALIVAGGAGSLFLGKNAIDASTAKPQSASANVDDIVQSVEDLGKVYAQCQALLDRNVFTFTHELVKDCRDPAAKRLAELTKKIDKQRAGFDQGVQAELARMGVIFNEDVREAVAVTSVTHAFDNEVVQSMKRACTPGAADQAPESAVGAVTKAGADAAAAQVRYYYLLKDFIAPELETAKAILRLHARATPAPEEMKAAAQRMELLLTDRMAYTDRPAQWPFTLAAAKGTSARDAAPTPGPENAAAETAHWRQVLAKSSTESLRGRKEDIEALISCGALKADARALAQPPGA